MMDQQNPTQPDAQETHWQPLAAIDRRISGVLIEKAKTTPDQYPLSLNAVRTGANQKSNRYPLMQLEVDDVEESLDRLRELGAVVEVQGSGRVVKFRHLMYRWFGVEKIELAVMAELLLRGAQRVGELRGRVARMEPVRDLAALQPQLDSLEEKNLVEYITPKGRGCVISHTLYLPKEMARVRAEMAIAADASEGRPDGDRAPSATATDAQRGPTVRGDGVAAAELGREVESLRDDVQSLRTELAALRDQLQRHFGESADTC